MEGVAKSRWNEKICSVKLSDCQSEVRARTLNRFHIQRLRGGSNLQFASFRAMSAAPQNSYRPLGYCPTCGYHTDAGRCPECGQAVLQVSKRRPRRLPKRALVLAIGAVLTTVFFLSGQQMLDAAATRFASPRLLRALAGANQPFSLWAERIFNIQERRLIETERVLADEREQAIRAAWLRIDSSTSWAGEYQDPANSETALLLCPGVGFVWRNGEQFEHGSLAEGSESTVVLKGRLARRLDQPNDVSLTAVRWGARRLLVRTDDLPEFCEFCNGGPLDANLLWVRTRDRGEPFGGTPDLPQRFVALLKPRPSTRVVDLGPIAEVIDFDETLGLATARFAFRCTVDRGECDGLRPGDSLRALFGDFDACTVLNATPDTSLVDCHGLLGPDEHAAQFAPRVGYELKPLGSGGLGGAGSNANDNAARSPARRLFRS